MWTIAAVKVLQNFWKYRVMGLVIVLLMCLIGVLVYSHNLNKDIDALHAKHQAYLAEQLEQSIRLDSAWKVRLELAEESYNERVKELERSNVKLSTSYNRVSVALSEAKRKYASASEEARAEYSDTLNTVSGQCIKEYRDMAVIAQQHANDAERLSKAWPK